MAIAIQEEASDAGSSFTFHALEKGGFAALQKPENLELLRKWNLEPTMQAKCFRFDQQFKPEQLDAFLLDFFNDATVQQQAPVSTGRENADVSALGKVTGVQHSRLSTTVLRLDFFDRLSGDSGVVHPQTGSISKCFDKMCGDVLVSDKLRLMLLDEESEEWETYSERERTELIFHIFKRLAVGGGLNQYEDYVKPYVDLTKAIYKDMVAVHKNVNGQLQVGSLTFAVSLVSGANASLFPRDSAHNFCYVTIDPIARHVKYWYSAFFPMM